VRLRRFVRFRRKRGEDFIDDCAVGFCGKFSRKKIATVHQFIEIRERPRVGFSAFPIDVAFNRGVVVVFVRGEIFVKRAVEKNRLKENFIDQKSVSAKTCYFLGFRKKEPRKIVRYADPICAFPDFKIEFFEAIYSEDFLENDCVIVDSSENKIDVFLIPPPLFVRRIKRTNG